MILFLIFIIREAKCALFDAAHIYPQSDFHIQSGKSIVLKISISPNLTNNCTIDNLKVYKGKYSIGFSKYNESMASLQIDNVTNKDSGFYQIICENEKKTFLGARFIKVIDPPGSVYDFKCYAHNWIEMQCKWKFNNSLDHHVLYYGVFQFPNVSAQSRCPSDADDNYDNFRIFYNKIGQYQDYIQQDQEPLNVFNKSYEGSCRFVNKAFDSKNHLKDEEIRFFPDWKYYFIMRSYNEIGTLYQNFTIDPKEIIKPDPPNVLMKIENNGINLHLLSSIIPYPDALSLTFSINISIPSLINYWKKWIFQIRTPLVKKNFTVPAHYYFDDGGGNVSDSKSYDYYHYTGSREYENNNNTILNIIESDNWKCLNKIVYGFGRIGTLAVNENANVFINHLIPFISYQILIKAKPRYKGYYSEPKILYAKTLPSAPRIIPETSPSAFEITRIYSEKFNKVTIYWKSVSQTFYFGPNFHYNLYDGETGIASNITHNFYSIQLPLDDFLFHNFTITAGNSQGESLPSQPLFLCQRNASISSPQNVRIIHFTQNQYSIIWNSQYVDNATHFTIYWCKIHQYIPFTCGPNINWQTITFNDSRIIYYNEIIFLSNNLSREQKMFRIMGFNLSLDTNFLAGIAFEPSMYNSTSQGIIWSLCVLKYDLEPKPPKLNPQLIFATSRSIKVEWVKEACQSEGSPISFYLLNILSNATLEYSLNLSRLIPYSKYPKYNINDLIPYTTYILNIRSISLFDQISRHSNYILIKTLEEAPENECYDILSNYISPNIYFTWKGPKISNGIIKYYILNISLMSTTSTSITRKREIYSYNFHFKTFKNEFEFKSKDWIGNENYTFSISACNQVGCSPLNKPPYIFVTPIKKPSKIEIIDYKVLNDSHILLLWKSPRIANGPISHFDIMITEKKNLNKSNIKSIKVKSPLHYPPSYNGYILKLECNKESSFGNQEIFPSYLISIRATTFGSGKYFIGPFSKPKHISILCYNRFSNSNKFKWNILTSIFSILVFISLIGLLVYYIKSSKNALD